MKTGVAVAGTVLILVALWAHCQSHPEVIGEQYQHVRNSTARRQTKHAQAASAVANDLVTTGRVNSEQGSSKISGGISNSDFEVALKGLASNANADAVEARKGLLRRWAEADPSAAAAWTAKLPQGSFYDEALQQVIVSWGESDLSSATRWLATLPQDESKRAATISLGYEAARADPQAALQLAATLSTAADTDNLLVYATSQWANNDVQAALSWASDIADSGLRQRLISAIAVASAKLNGAVAAEMVASLLPPGDEQNRAAVAVVQRWAQVSPQAAADWVALYPEGPTRVTADAILNELAAAQESAITVGEAGSK